MQLSSNEADSFLSGETKLRKGSGGSGVSGCSGFLSDAMSGPPSGGLLEQGAVRR